MINNCLRCNKEFYIRPSKIKIGKGKFCSKICFDVDQKENPRNFTINAYQWKGEKAGYKAKHRWLYKHFGFPMTCEFCHKTFSNKRKIQWANISGKYHREREDWMRLCAKCHAHYDNRIEKRELNKRVNKLIVLAFPFVIV